MLDTCFISEFAKSKPEPKVIDFLKSINETEVYISAITIGEIHRGIQKLPNGKKKSNLLIWLQKVEKQFAQKILSYDAETSVEWAKICVRAENKGKRLSSLDSIIAAIASKNGMVLVTRNVKDFEHTELEIINPWM